MTAGVQKQYGLDSGVLRRMWLRDPKQQPASNQAPRTIAETLAEQAPRSQDPDVLLAAVRARLRDPVMWTLKVELWFYAMLGGAFAIIGRRIKWAIWLLLPLLVWLYRFAPVNGFQTIVCYFPLMFAGSWVYFYQTGHAGRVETVLHFIGMLALYVWLTGWGDPGLYASYGIGVALFVAGALRPQLVAAPLLTRVASVSYAWYVCHATVGYAILFTLAQYGTPWWAMVAIALAVTWGIAQAIHRWVELPTQRLGKVLSDKLK